jgi:hypothetical protein
MKYPAIVRREVVFGVQYMLERLRIRISSSEAGGDLDVLRLLERPAQFDLAEAVALMLMERLGGTAPKELRFDKTHREIAKRRGRPPRGIKTAGDPLPSDAEGT